MSLFAAWMMGRLLRDVTSGTKGPREGVVETVVPDTWSEHPWRVYEPRAPARPRGNLLLVHGVSARASDDPLLVHLARSIGSLGYRCLTPSLPEIANFRHSDRDIDTLVEAILYASESTGGRISVLSFSYGAAYALRAAADPRCRERCHHVLGFGAYYLLDEALAHQRKMLVEHPTPDEDDADLAYLRYTLLVCNRDTVSISAEGWAAIDAVLETFTSPGTAEQKRAALVQHARNIDYLSLMDEYRSRNHSERLSPAGVLQEILCPISLLHDPDDRFVPAGHVERIRAELDERTGVARTVTLTTPMFSHVQVAPMRGLLQLPKLVSTLKPIFWL